MANMQEFLPIWTANVQEFMQNPGNYDACESQQVTEWG